MRELLLLLSRYPYDNKDRPAIERAIGRVSDWTLAVELVNRHGIIALAAYNINQSGLSLLIPPEAMAQLNNGHKQTLLRNTWLTQRWKELNSILMEAGIKHVLLKGMALEYTIYGGLGLRQMSDNDILIKPKDCEKAWNLLRAHGFKEIIAKSSYHRELNHYFSLHLPALTKDNYTIEIHHKLSLPDQENSVIKIVDNAIAIDIDGTKAYIPEYKTHKAFLLEHLNKHKKIGDFELRQYADLENLEPGSAPELTDEFLFNRPKKDQIDLIKTFSSLKSKLPKRFWLKYIAGELIPSAEWMKNKYRCKGWQLVWYYPYRIGKIIWTSLLG